MWIFPRKMYSKIVDFKAKYAVNLHVEKDTKQDIDKVKELGPTLEDPDKISVPGIKELPLTLECKIVYTTSTR